MSILLDQGPDDEAAIRRARANSNRAIVKRNLLGVGDYVAVVGNGGFVASKKEYLSLFKQEFDSGSQRLIYDRIADKVEVNPAGGLSAEHGHWIARRDDGVTAVSGTYMAMWQRTPGGWKIRSELFVTLQSAESLR
jgi:ketosteroid isomerase-like protein